ncbi:hypothetical protein NKR23_g4668 [Pleurostoma richardsiae]|uniref:Uncharacterized protein n=1 Tax=Pleurostoma richardsiae TaxID=41990 RepID=A0AA38RIT4_9PEZI|nr:hypothetical protein NKR23_g4668 [Pleurostoma richardsiae]
MASAHGLRGFSPLTILSSTKPLSSSFLSISCRTAAASPSPLALASRAFSTTPAPQKRHVEKKDPKIISLMQGLSTTTLKRAPPPLRMARNRHLRHWTIHRAWLLFRRRQRDAREREMMRMYQGMHNACEELRMTEGPGSRPQGYLYRVAMEKKGVFGHHGVPIEYARAQTETPAKEAWNHGWKR